jgi:hypothetical protein
VLLSGVVERTIFLCQLGAMRCHRGRSPWVRLLTQPGLRVCVDIDELIICRCDAHHGARRHDGVAARGGGGVQGLVGGIHMTGARTT